VPRDVQQETIHDTGSAPCEGGGAPQHPEIMEEGGPPAPAGGDIKASSSHPSDAVAMRTGGLRGAEHGAKAVVRVDMGVAMSAAFGSSAPVLPQLWSAESPDLYVLVLELLAPSGEVLEVEACQLGFRHTEVAAGQLLHNGRLVMMRGVNRHEWHPQSGKVVDERHMVRVGGWWE